MSARPTVVFTRPRGQGAGLRQRLAEAGFGVLEVPAFEIAAPADPAAVAAQRARLGEFDLIHFASVNALRGLLDAPGAGVRPGACVAVMGPGSRAEAERHPALAGATIVTPGQQLAGDPPALDSETLLVTLDALGLARGRALLVKGDGGRDALALGLAARGMQIEPVEVYRRLCPALTDADRAALAALIGQPATVVATSSEGIANFHTMLAPWPALAGWLAGTPVVVTHPRVALRAQALGIAHVRLCAPGDDAIFRLLETGAQRQA
ncbi:uroporphyrinogen-III synthase [Derxia lacustris]|uniref:uroporphyrinogen-III synthase n=1 Tax=Derxia lacustris TaxID=764842 RepID=UPI000A172607|nr:uroporphyrinogen-III synthase [Derxia lacustris]